MAAGIETLGIAYFSAVKFVGYSVAAYYLKRSYGEARGHALVIGGVRTAIGIAVGIPLAVLCAGFAADGANPVPIFLALLLPARILEWLLLFVLFFRRRPMARSSVYLTLCVVWSYALDVPAWFALAILPGGFWVC